VDGRLDDKLDDRPEGGAEVELPPWLSPCCLGAVYMALSEKLARQ
jgi:hypothetical protein